MLTISLDELCRYTAATPTTRNAREVQRVINSGLLIMCGVTAETSVNIELYALCLQTSSMGFFHRQARGRWRQASSVLFTHTPLNS